MIKLLVLLIISLNVLTVDSNIQLSIKCHYPGSQLGSDDSLYIRGDGLGLNWKSGIPLNQVKDDLWEISLSGQSVTQLELKILIDDQTWQIGSNEIFQFSSGNSDFSADVYPFFQTQEGTIETIKDVYSPQLENTRNIAVYLPPSFYENSLKPVKYVLVMHDGQNLFDPKTSFMQPWWCQNALNQEIVEGNMPEVMIIGPWNTPDREDEYTYSYDKSEQSGGKGDKYLDFVEKVVVPKTQEHYGGSERIQIDRANLGILGSSLGGLISCYAGWTRSSVYKRIGCMSSSLWWNNEDFISTVMKDDPLPEEDTVFYMDTGTVNDCYNSTMDVKSVIETMKQFKKNDTFFFYLDVGATHNEYYWGKRFHIPIVDLFPIEPTVL